MDKQTKQLIFLGIVVVVGGIVLAFIYLGGDDEDGSTTAGNEPAEINTPQAPDDDGPQPAGRDDGPKPAGRDGEKGDTPETKIEDKEIPPDVKTQEVRYAWPWQPVPEEPPEDYTMPYDPLFVQNIDVVDPERKKHVEALKEDWVLEGIMETWQDVDIVDEQGNKIGSERKLIKEAWFKGKRRPYKEKDRLTNTRFQIKSIFTEPEKGVSGCVLLGDTGAQVRMELAPPDRYNDDDK